MLSQRTLSTRIPSLRPLRPPSTSKRTQRPFTRLTPPRPQLPYLAQTHQRPLNGPSGQLARLLSSSNRSFVKQQFYLAAKWTVLGWTFLVLGGIAYFGVNIEMDERTNPTPSEWRWQTRQLLRAVRVFSDEEQALRSGTGIVDWAQVGTTALKLLARLEDGNHEAKGLHETLGDDEGEILIPGVGKAGYDISEKSWPWKAGYVEALMLCAKAAEHLDGMVLDRTRNLVFPKDVVIGPSNPDPRPTPPYMKAAPREEDCVRPYPAPETFYMKIITGKGFTTGQQLEAALGFANWLEFQGTNEAATEMYRWAVDIAKAGLKAEIGQADVLDEKTYVLKESATADVTPNILKATTALASHHARTGHLDQALPILLSVLRARRTAPVSPFPPSPTTGASNSSLWSLIFVPPKFPDPPQSGDIPVVRPTPQPTCAESELMLYIGEILFAGSNSNTEEGLSWTKQAVTVADGQLSNKEFVELNTVEAEIEKKKCKECLLTGVGNWELMVQRLLEQSEQATTRPSSWKFWQSRGTSASSIRKEELVNDQARIDSLKDRIIREGMNHSVPGGQNTGIWFG
ncbi:hypothetical protein CKM354_000150700 [Cercospora kikuchii]|uniref:MFS maltose permease n=1 Tax=Cercospora kikuchii TaxID=84275 RepID=A0A9P3C8D9_9PEZI|nr:uncharacterized protein CKM354_000150700 [Cercospora kikuchii]GIZ38081.1 hypothetical protein CKM354_000150700 [Cercospora kikuchii]